MATTSLGDTALIFGGVRQILITPYTSAGVLGTDSYSLDQIVADTTSITQEDNTTNAIDSETKDEPIYENITLGRYTVTMNSGDIQADLLTKVMGFTMSGTNIIAPTTYKPVWAKVEAVFDDGSLVCPKVKISGRIEAASLKTGIVQGVISGTCYAGKVGDAAGAPLAPFYVSPKASGGA